MARDLHGPYRGGIEPPLYGPTLPASLKVEKVEIHQVHLHLQLENAAKHLETERAKAVAKAPEPQIAAEPEAEPIVLHFTWLDFEREKAALGLTDFQAYLKRKTAEATREIEAITDADERVARLIEPPQREEHSLLSRIPYWRIWKKQMGGTALQTLLWPRVGPALWARYEEKLEAYRRVETDDPAPKLEQKLTPSELKKWIRKGEVKPTFESINLLTREGTDPKGLVLAYGWARYLESTLPKLNHFNKLVQRVAVSQQMPEPDDFAKIYGFNSGMEMEADFQKWLAGPEFR